MALEVLQEYIPRPIFLQLLVDINEKEEDVFKVQETTKTPGNLYDDEDSDFKKAVKYVVTSM